MSFRANHSQWLLRVLACAAFGLATAMGLSNLSTARAQHDSVTISSILRLPHVVATPAHSHPHWFQLGRASWYGKQFQGQPTASGEIFDMNGMTCAHRSLPLGALIRVTNLRNHRSVVVRVNDRGPLTPSRIVDVSYAAAKALGFHGTSRVRLDLINPSPTAEEVARMSWPENPGQ